MSAGLKLIVNADDFGISEAVNRGIVEAFDGGIVTSTSLMATGAAFEHAVELARARPGLSVGVHLVLTEHRPLIGAAAAASLVEPDGTFAPHLAHLLAKRLRGAVSLAEVRLELDAQIRRVREAGIAITHVDGHQHAHVLPGIAAVVADLAAKHGIFLNRPRRLNHESAYSWGPHQSGPQLAGAGRTCSRRRVQRHR